MVKHTQTVRRLLSTNCLGVFDHFVGLALKGLVVREGDLNRRGCQSNLINLIITVIKKDFFSNLKSKTQNILLKILLIL